jgi:hypothetical protein
MGVMQELHCNFNGQSHSLIVDYIVIILIHKQAELLHAKSPNKNRCALCLQNLQLVIQVTDCHGIKIPKQDSYC